MRLVFSLRPYIASSQHRLTALPYRRLAVRSIVHRSIAHRRRLNSSLAADRTAERQGLDGREASILQAKYAPQSQSEQATSSPLARYHKLVDSGVLRYDAHQERIIGKLQKLHDEVATYQPPPSLMSSRVHLCLLASSAGQSTSTAQRQPRTDQRACTSMAMSGLARPCSWTSSTRHPATYQAQAASALPRLHDRRAQAVHATKAKLGYQGGDIIGPVARELASEAYILCFDEFQVTDIADAMILRQLFERLLNHGVICVITSKWVMPVRMYHDADLVVQSTSR
ncbi:AFG1-like ATPase-domain-containing protein [Fomitopsis serialis]|uniref:AFG1-like ATPase-domain-containing protein n=1 Tax=Fomitopsis serialis TaxID=139415 RepID=UPI002007237B|nr:AFG1-like ATPase-domain-containing protein [Neoantrodia serialis]KAH9937993.1 AFG1-like ATPase-domain-containing protein [Neoantrodia serialis]